MTRQQLHSALAEATTSTFEELALLLVAPAAGDPPHGGTASAAVRPSCGVRVDFDGPWGGSVLLRVDEAVLDAAAANMLGIAAAPDAPARRDALGELANVVCGNLLPVIAGRAAVFALQAPRWIGAAAAACAPADVRVAVVVTVDEGRVAAELHVPAPLVAAAGPGALAEAVGA